MKAQLSVHVAYLVFMLLGVVGCTTVVSPPTPTAVSEPAVDPAAAVVMDYVALVNAGDYAGAAEYFADDAMAYFVGMPPTGMEIYSGREQYQAFLNDCCTGQNFEMDVTFERVVDGIVYAEAKTWMDFTRGLGVAPNSFHELFVVEDGKIALYTSTMTEEALAAFKPVLLEALPELAQVMQPPIAGDETPATELALTVANGACTHDGSMILQAGEITLTVDVRDQTWDKYAVSLFTLDEDKDLVDLMAATYRPSPPAWSDMSFLVEMPNDSQTWTYTPEIEEGLLYVVCWAGNPDSAVGNAGPFIVVE